MKSDRQVEIDKLLEIIQREYLTLNNFMLEVNFGDLTKILTKLAEIENTLVVRNTLREFFN